MTVATNSTPAKRCVICGADLSQAKRTKVPSGDYYCEACYRKQTPAIVAAPGAAMAPRAAAAGIERRIYLALGAALVIMIAMAIAVYAWFSGPSRKMVVVAPGLNTAAPASNARVPSKASVPAFAAADINARDDHGRTALNLAAAHGDIDQVKLLLDKGANVNAKDSDGATPLHAAARKGHLAIAELLVARGADVNAASNNGATPLHLAGAYGNMGLADWLAGKVADVNARDNVGRTPLKVTTNNKHDATAAAIRRHGGTE